MDTTLNSTPAAVVKLPGFVATFDDALRRASDDPCAAARWLLGDDHEPKNFTDSTASPTGAS